ncbi:peptide-methionine (R)-S-oxide reductase MsrB [Hydrogenophilus thermoluteolus]|jgi:peptide methionine sulfoxide reductase msrA/msrB|uniref:Peptide methionine sulfoxide reductase MsrA n=1 Tax=Hydrogenophilus thermoluteolus TaxID=297 RepID=A0A2Z6E0J1_HYDTE|nr:peptide-methionine (R)-S-oxide reductase MsrB [Hydrogenophilus thermoluteolus]BBD78273.1 peptide methionine sulfoxide reductase [Hydrogenophilus thermoluteolus]GLW60431.1 peptide-methionine (R)-S-oxide reductase [Hydrogenophilus thermoluteolus]HNQ48126.1 peptide-methionine (R)-S-oxide reductase MsrB [Hydrogenophilus thermoluteolus]
MAQEITLYFGMGCFWGAQQRLRVLPGVVATEVGYAGGDDPNPTYERVLAFERALRAGVASGRNHAEVVKVVWEPPRSEADQLVPLLAQLLAAFWAGHDPTQRDRQGNDIGSNYRSALYYEANDDAVWLLPLLLASRAAYAWALWQAAGGAPRFSAPTTEIAPVRHYTPAESYHQDYLIKHPDGYCGLGGTGVHLPPYPWTLPGAELRAFWAWLGQAVLSPEAFAIAFEHGTERPFTGCHLHEKRPGRFFDPLSGALLFRSATKFESGSGWPSFFAAEPDAVTEHEDRSYGMVRTEVRSRATGIHLGHVFPDGPPPTGLRYCINGNVLAFAPGAEAEGAA